MDAFIIHHGGSCIAFAAISVKYPSGSVCTCSNGSKTLKAKDTSGNWLCVVPSGGTWTISITDGSYSSSTSVSVEQNKSYSVELDYNLVIYNHGYMETAKSGGLNYLDYVMPSVSGHPYTPADASFQNDRIVFNGATTNPYTCPMTGTYLPLDLSQYNRLVVTGKVTSQAGDVGLYVRVLNSKNIYSSSNLATYDTTKLGDFTCDLDISSIKTNGYIVVLNGYSPSCKGEIYKIELLR